MAEDRWDLESGPPIAVFAEQDVVGEDAVVDFWVREGALDEEKARRRVADLHVVAVEDGEVVATTSAFLRRDERLRMPLWHYRGFVGAAHRRSVIGLRMAILGRDDLSERFVSGRDRRAGGILWEVQNEGLRRAFPEARWMPTDFTFVGENAYGDHVRVHYFPGALAPPPPGQGST